MNTQLSRSLDTFIRKYYKNQLIKGGVYAAILILSLFLLFSGLEYFGYLSSLVRALIFWSFILALLGILGYYVVNPLLKMYRLGNCLSYADAAKIIGNHFPEVSDKLLNLLQLQEMSEEDASSAELLRASIDQKTALLSPIPFSQAINLGANKKYLKFLAIPVVIVLLLLCLLPSFLVDSSNRIIHYNTAYERPAPFSFVVENPALQAVQHEDFLLRVAVVGDVLPAESFLVIDGKRYKMTPIDKSHFTYLFKQVHADCTFSIEASGVKSTDYQLSVFSKPTVIDFQVSLNYPGYTHQSPTLLANQGDITVSQGTSVQWIFQTKDVDTLYFYHSIDETKIARSSYVPDKHGRVTIPMRAMRTLSYGFFASNSNAPNSDTLRYMLSVIPDAAPMIAVVENVDSADDNRRIFQGRIKDDYGFSSLSFIVVKSSINDTVKKAYSLSLTSDPVQEFAYVFNLDQMGCTLGDKLEYYFQVCDNDAVNGHKCATSQHFDFNIPTEEELAQQLETNSREATQSAERSISELKMLQKEIDEMMRKLVDKKELTWQDKKQLQDLAKKHEQVRQQLQKMQDQFNQNAQLEQQYKEQSEEILSKQEELDRLFNELLSEEMKDMMDQIQDLLKETDKDKVQQKLEDMRLSNEELERQLDQDLELMHRLELEKKVEETVNQMDKLAEEQKKLADETKNASKDQQQNLENQQQKLSQQFDQLKKDIEQIKKDYKDIEPEHNFNVDNKLQEKISQEQQKAADDIKKGKKKEAAQEQQEAAQDMEQLAEQLQQAQQEMEDEELAEDSDVIRQLLKNLVQLSFDQESLIDQVYHTYIQDPKYQKIIASQNKIKEDYGNVRDSLQQIAKRQPQVATAITKDVGDAQQNIAKSLSGLLSFNQSFYGNAHNTGVAPSMQYSMTAFNNLALILAESLDDMKNQMRQNNMMRQGGKNQKNSKQKIGGMCSNPGKNKPSPKSMRQMQEELNKQMEALKKQLEKDGDKTMGRKKFGENNGMSEQFGRMAAQQEMIRRMMQQYAQEMKEKNPNNSKLAKEIEDIMQSMEQTETDLVNRVISQGTLQRQKQIMTRLLQHENAELQQEKEEKRESKQAVEHYQPSPAELQQFKQMQKGNIELFRSTPPSLSPYYKNKVTNYFFRF